MNVFKAIVFSLPVIFTAQTAAAGAEVLAEVGAENVTRAYLEEARKLQQGSGMPAVTDEGFLRHLVDRKLFAQLARAKYPEERDAVEKELARQLEVTLAGEFFRRAVTEKVEPVTEEEVARHYRDRYTYDIHHWAFMEKEAAQLFIDDFRTRPKEFLGDPSEAEFKNLTLPAKPIPPELEAALADLAPGDFFGPVKVGKYHIVYRLDAARGPAPDRIEADKSKIRAGLRQERERELKAQLFVDLKTRLDYRENDDLIGKLFRDEVSIGDLDGTEELAFFGGRSITTADLEWELAAYRERTRHNFLQGKTVVRLLNQSVTTLLAAEGAREMKLHEEGSFKAYEELYSDIIWSGVITTRVQAEASQVTEEELRKHFEEKRSSFEGPFEMERSAVKRSLLIETLGRKVRELREEAAKSIPIRYVNPL